MRDIENRLQIGWNQILYIHQRCENVNILLTSILPTMPSTVSEIPRAEKTQNCWILWSPPDNHRSMCVSAWNELKKQWMAMQPTQIYRLISTSFKTDMQQIIHTEDAFINTWPYERVACESRLPLSGFLEMQSTSLMFAGIETALHFHFWIIHSS